MADIDYSLTFILKHVRAANEKRGAGGLARIFRVETRSNLLEKEKKGERERERTFEGWLLLKNLVYSFAIYL